MLKSARAGRVKTRLAREIGAGRAAQLFRQMTAHTLAVSGSGPWRSIVALDPPKDVIGFSRLHGGVDVMPQASGDLGARMAAAMEAAPAGPVVVIGADAPGMRPAHLHAAFAALKRCDAVFGPAADGGYWLIGLARWRRAPRLFDGVRWSSEHALDDTIASLPGEFRVARLDRLTDVDTAEDLRNAPPLLRAKKQY